MTVNGLMYLILGVLFFLRFDWLTEALDLGVTSTSGKVELLTVYGGLELGMGALFIFSVFFEGIRRFALILLLMTYLWFFTGRAIAMFIFGASDVKTYILIGIELVGWIISGLLLFQRSRSRE
jgi:hypothetical protein